MQRSSVALMILSLLAARAVTLFAADTTTAKFDEPKRPQNWSVNFGHWEPADGVLVCRELAKDSHPAASRWQIPIRDGTIKLKLKFAGAKVFHLGFDPAPGQLKKQGHLYSLVITPNGAQIKKHKDKADTAAKDENVATATAKLPDDWIDVTLTTEGDKVMATVGKNIKLEASDATFHVAKPAVVFRVVGGDVQIDDVEVTVTKAGEPAAAQKASK